MKKMEEMKEKLGVAMEDWRRALEERLLELILKLLAYCQRLVRSPHNDTKNLLRYPQAHES